VKLVCFLRRSNFSAGHVITIQWDLNKERKLRGMLISRQSSCGHTMHRGLPLATLKTASLSLDSSTMLHLTRSPAAELSAAIMFVYYCWCMTRCVHCGRPLRRVYPPRAGVISVITCRVRAAATRLLRYTFAAGLFVCPLFSDRAAREELLLLIRLAPLP
jgi:hypothetical protein